MSKESFDRLLACLSPDRELAGEIYEKLRGKLIWYFQCRDCPSPDDHADEVINRVARKLESGEEVRDPATYIYGVGRLLLLEILKERSRQKSAIEHLSRSQSDYTDDEDEEQTVECFKACLGNLTPENRELITKYYEGERRTKIESRNRLAERLAIPISTLRIRAFRIRNELGNCVKRCLKRTGKKLK